MLTSNRLEKTKSLKSNNSNTFYKTNLTNNQRIIPYEDYAYGISEMEQYYKERENCDKYRIIVTINPMCSNVLYNRITEVILNEGSDECQCLNYKNPSEIINAYKLPILCKDNNGFDRVNLLDGSRYLTRDTQLSREECGAVYKCGLDIFNNHILRSDSFKCVCVDKGKYAHFNSLLDMMREADGTIVEGYKTDSNDKINLHLYLAEDVLDFEDAVDNKLDEDNGWLGFVNKSKILTFNETNYGLPLNDGQTLEKGEPLNINRVINNKPSCGFVDLCPERDLWYLTPKYNKARHRFEKNWNYCLTYPSSSTTEDISFIREKTNSLKVLYYDDTVKLGGVNVCKISSVSKHGLIEGDFINLYVNGTKLYGTITNKDAEGVEDTETVTDNDERVLGDDEIIENLEVRQVIDDYTFYVNYSSSNWISTSHFINWKSEKGFENQVADIATNNETYTWSAVERNYVTLYDSTDGTEHKFQVFVADDGSYCANIDNRSNDISFKQVINNEEVEYYVRIFQKLPNWRFAEKRINEYSTDEEREELITEYSSKAYDFESHLSKLAFAKNSYGDDISQIVFTDDVEIKNLKDNLGRDVTEIYLTLFKNNAGYREWYGKNMASSKDNINVGDNTIEYSHVFGKLSCAFELSPQSALNASHKNVLQTNNVKGGEYCMGGLDMNILNKNRPSIIDDDEIEYNTINDPNEEQPYQGDTRFYGDLCLYSPSTLGEIVIDDIWFRFNTAQRELTENDKAYPYLERLAYDNITYDDYDSAPFSVKQENKEKGCQSNEGYRYKPHYKIQLKTFGKTLETANAYTSKIVTREHVSDDTENNESTFKITTSKTHYNELNDTFVIFNTNRNEYYLGTVIQIYDDITFKCVLKKEKPNKNIKVDLPQMFDEIDSYVFVRKQEIIPQGATLLKNGSLQYAWRQIYQNGLEPYNTEETYPFTNNALYVEKNIRLFVKRQDPDRVVGSLVNSGVNDVEPKKDSIFDENNYYNNDDISCV